MGAKQGDPGTGQGVMGAHSGAMVGETEKTEMGEGHGKTGRSSRFSSTDSRGHPRHQGAVGLDHWSRNQK